MTASIAQIYRYPVKGLTPESLPRVALTPGEGLPADRRYALHVGNSPFDATAPQWMAKTNFLMLMRDERLAKLRTRFDDKTNVLTIERDGKRVAHGDLTDPNGRIVVEQFFAAYMGNELRRGPRIVSAPGHMFSDVAARVVSVIGLGSVRDLERVVRGRVDPLRFRANFYVEDLPAWTEFGWVGQEIGLGGTVRAKVIKRIKRCAATNVDPVTGARDLNLPLALQNAFGHVDCGVYAEILTPGEVVAGDAVVAAQ
jgi:uncharacterized protein YcbX